MATNLDLAGKVARNVDLRSVNLRYARVEASCEPEDIPEEASVDLQYRSSINKRKRRDDPAAVELAVTVDFKFHVQRQDEDAPSDVILLEAGYLLVYALNPEAELEEECFDQFAEVNGPYNAWPYWRELVQSVTGRLGLPGFVLPVFRPAKKELEAPPAEGERQS